MSDNKVIDISFVVRPGESLEEWSVRQILLDFQKRMEAGFKFYYANNHLDRDVHTVHYEWMNLTDDDREQWVDKFVNHYLANSPRTKPEQLSE